MPYDISSYNFLAARHPSLPAAVITVGGLAVTCEAAAAAAAVLAASRTSAIAPVLRAAGSPLAGCDYFSEAGPYLAAARAAPKTGRAGAAGRHVTKEAFCAAVADRITAAAAAEHAAALGAFGADERYAAQMARAAVGIRERAHAAGVRSALRSAAHRAVASCQAVAGQFSCAEPGACGTGSCRFAQPPYTGLSAPAGPGRITRPPNHRDAGQGFSEAAAAAEMASAVSYRAGVPVSDCWPGRARGKEAA